MSASNLSPGNIAREVFDPSLEAIKVSLVGAGSPTIPAVTRLSDGIGYLTSTVSGPNRALDVNIINEIEIAIDHTEDSIRLGDGTNYITTSPISGKNALDVVFQDGDVISVYDEVTGLTSGITQTITQFTATGITKLKSVSVNGTNIGEYTVEINSVVIDKAYTNFNGGMGVFFDFKDGLVLASSDIVEVKVIHNRPFVGDFNARIQLAEL